MSVHVDSFCAYSTNEGTAYGEVFYELSTALG